MNIFFEQCNDATTTKVFLGTTYKTDCHDGNIISFLVKLRTVFYGNDNGGLSFKPYKNIVSVKSLNNFSKAKSNDPHGLKKELKIKYDAILAVVGKFSNRTGPMMELLKVETPARSWADYYAMNVLDQAMWEVGREG